MDNEEKLKINISPQEVVVILNELLELDRSAITELVRTRVSCNRALADHPTVQVLYNETEDKFLVGILGILNGFFGIKDGFGAIIAVYNTNKDGELTTIEKFCHYDEYKNSV